MTHPDAPQASASRDLFFRVADHLQLEGCMHAVAQECKSVVMLSPSAALLDHYGQILVQRLRQHLPNASTEVFLPTDTDALIARFNALLEHLSVDAATQLTEPSAPKKLWIIHDANTLPEHELKLLLRLLQNFPGARISAVLMLSEWPAALRGVDPQGRRILRWDIEPPTPTQIEQFLNQARELGRETAALELVSRVCALETGATSATSPSGSTAAMPTSAGTASANTHAEPAIGKPATKPASVRKHGMAWVALTLLAFSVAVALWLQNQTAPVSSPAPAPTASAPEASAAPAIATELPEIAEQGLAWLRAIGPGVFVVDHGLFATAEEAQKKIDNGHLYGARVLPHYPDTSSAAQFMVVTGPYPTEERARNFSQHAEQSANVRSSASVLALAQPNQTTPGVH